MHRSKRLRVGRGIIISLVAGLGVWACGGSDEEKLKAAKLAEGCQLNSNCEDPLVCTFQRCHQECEEDRDCRTGERCVQSKDGPVCQLPIETNCRRDNECNVGQVCGVDNECRDPCVVDRDCTKGQLCAKSGECASTDPTRDTLDDEGNILPDDPISPGAGGTNGSGDAGAGGLASEEPGSAGAGGSSAGAGGSSAGAGGSSGGEPPACEEGYADCDSSPGCETPLNLITSCGSCESTCDSSHGRVTCDESTYACVIEPDGCDAGYDDCDLSAATGCESQLAVDKENCGACGRSCGGATCTAGKCGPESVIDPAGNQSSSQVTAFLTGERIVAQMYVGGWQLRTTTLPPEVPASEGTILQSYVGTGTTIGSMTADATHAYFSLVATPSSVLRKALTGAGAATEVFSAPGAAQHLRVSATAFYFFAYGPFNATTSGYNFYTVSRAGGTPTVVPGLSQRYSSIQDLLVTPSRLYWVEYSATPAPASYRVFSAPIGGGTPLAVDSSLGPSGSTATLAFDGTHVYWNVPLASGRLRRIPHAATLATAVRDVAVGVNNPREGLAVDDEYLYYVDTSYNVTRVVKDGSLDPEIITTVNTTPYFQKLFAVDDQYAYGVGYYGDLIRVVKTP